MTQLPDPRATTSALRVPTVEVLSCLSVAGGLSMGLPADHGARVAVLADRIAGAAGSAPADRGAAVVAALLRWTGCTANASEFAHLLGDDVRGRATLVSEGAEAFTLRQQTRLHQEAPLLATAHCEVAQRLADRLGATAPVIDALGAVFEQWDGDGFPDGLAGARLPAAQRLVMVAGDLEVMLRLAGPAATRRHLLRSAGRRHDPRIAELAVDLLPNLVTELDDVDVWDLLPGTAAAHGFRQRHLLASVALLALADFADLKLPWNAGMSRRAAQLAAAVAAEVGGDGAVEPARAAVLVHGIGRAAVSNALWELPRPLHRAEWEQIRLVPYHTERCLDRAGGLASLCRAATLAFERLDGSGYYRGLAGSRLDTVARTVQASVAYAAMTAGRPWRTALGPDRAAAELVADAGAGRLDPQVVRALGRIDGLVVGVADRGSELTAREEEVLRYLAAGHTNRMIAQRLFISPKTVSRHLEAVYRKLDVRSRAGATLAAMEHGLVQDVHDGPARGRRRARQSGSSSG